MKGKHTTVDATTIQANASLGSLAPIVVAFEPEEYLDTVEEDQSESQEDQPPLPKTGEKLSNQTHRSRVDQDARIFRKQGRPTQLAYSNNMVVVKYLVSESDCLVIHPGNVVETYWLEQASNT